jgi:hypothetical protein
MKIWEPKPPGTLRATPGLLGDCFTFFFTSMVEKMGFGGNMSMKGQLQDLGTDARKLQAIIRK